MMFTDSYLKVFVSRAKTTLNKHLSNYVELILESDSCNFACYIRAFFYFPFLSVILSTVRTYKLCHVRSLIAVRWVRNRN